MPMANISTPKSSNSTVKSSRPTPRKSTLDFVRQFARVYTPLPNLHPAMGAVILN